MKYIKKPDMDRDNVTDSKEINVRRVKIIRDHNGNNTPISKEVVLYKDPLQLKRMTKKLKEEKMRIKIGSYILWIGGIIVALTITVNFLLYNPIDNFREGAFYLIGYLISLFCIAGGYTQYKKASKIKPMILNEEYFTWPYYNWPTENGIVQWNHLRKIILYVKEMPSFMFIILEIDGKKEIYPLPKYAVYDINRFLDVAKKKGIEVVEDEIRLRKLQKLRENL